jgi:hypothetical protein
VTQSHSKPDFLRIKEYFEDIINGRVKFELLELSYTPYSFGSGFAAYRIAGKIVKLVFDGRDEMLTIGISAKHSEYPPNTDSPIFSGTHKELNTEKMNLIIEKIKR